MSEGIHLLDQIPFQIDLDKITKTLNNRQLSVHAAKIEKLAQAALPLGHPKAIYSVETIRAKGQNFIDLGRGVFTSRVLRVNVENTDRVFVGIVTCGQELHDWVRSINDPLLHYWADAIAEVALRSAIQYFEDHLLAQYQISHISRMEPGSLPDWPLTEQRVLFELLGDTQATVGVCLTDSLLMSPTKTISGVWFASENEYANCQLCPREECPSRRAPYDENLFEQRYHSAG
jgi:hypothetical protein